VVRRCQLGEMDAFRELYLFYGKAIHHLALSMLSDLDEAGDILQELFLKVHDKIGEYHFKAPFAAWFYRVAVNLCQDRLRRRSRRHRWGGTAGVRSCFLYQGLFANRLTVA